MNWKLNKFLIFLGDAAIVFIALGFAILIRRPGHFSIDYYSLNLGYFIYLFPLWFLVFYILGLYDTRDISRTDNLLRDSVISCIVNIALSTGFFYILYYQNTAYTPKTNLLLTAFITTILIFAWRRFWVKYLLVKVLNEKVAFWGENELTESIKKDLREKPHLGFSVVNMPEINTDFPKSRDLFEPVYKQPSARERKINLLVIDRQKLDDKPDMANSLISLAINSDIPILSHLDFYEMLYNKIPPEYAGRPNWLFSNVLNSHNKLYLFIKEKSETIFAFLLIVILLPVFVMIIILSFIFDRHNPFYRQKRSGHLGKEFDIWKFTTMKAYSDKMGPLYKSKGRDTRITFFGKFLRRFRLDEIPQLINVVKGEMSFVGPRPEWIKEVKILEQKIPHYNLRHLVKPGMTGWAQVNFKATSDAGESLEKLRYDLYYVKNVSFIMDLRIILRTIKRIFTREKHYGLNGKT